LITAKTFEEINQSKDSNASPCLRPQEVLLHTVALHPRALPMSLDRKADCTFSRSAEQTTKADEPLEKAEAAKEKSESAMDGMKGEKALDDAIGDKGPDPEVISADDDLLEKAEVAKEKK
jgi:hypothetical protein